MKKFGALLLSLSLALLGASVAFADATTDSSALKIAVIDLQKIMQKSPQVAAVNSQLEREFKPRQEKILASQKDLQAQMEKLKREGASMKEEDRNKLQNKIITDRANFQAAADAFQQDLNNAQSKAMQKIMQQIASAVNNVADAKKYDLILQKSSAPYANAKLDVTDDVIKALGK